MKRTELVHVAVAETSVIVRSGLVAVLKRMPDLIIQPVEITSLVPIIPVQPANASLLIIH